MSTKPLEHNPFDTDVADIDATLGEPLNQLFGKAINYAEADEARTSALPPKGRYTTMPDEFPGTAKAQQPKPWDPERLVVRITVRGEGLFDGKTVSTLLSYDISPDKRPKRLYDGERNFVGVDETQADLPFRLWVDALKVAEVALKRRPERVEEILQFLTTHMYKCNAMRGDDGLRVVALEPRYRR